MATSSETTSNQTIITLQTSDNQVFEISENLAMFSATIKYMIEDGCANNVIPLPNVDGKTLANVIEYFKNHADESLSDDEKANFDKKFVSDKPNEELFDCVLAANYLNIKDLLNIVCQEVAERIKDKSPEYVRDIFNIQNDFTAEEEDEVRNEYAWAHDDVATATTNND